MKLKICLILSFVSLSVGSVLAIYTGLHPAFFGGLAVSVLCLFAATALTQNYVQYWATLTSLIIVSASSKLFVFLYPASLIGLDPDWYASQVSNIVETGSVVFIDSAYYMKVPLSIVLPSVFSEATGLSPENSLSIFAICTGIVIPLVVLAILRRITSDKTSLFGAVFASIGSVIFKYSFWPIAQSLAVLLFAASILTLVYVFAHHEKRWRAQILVLLLSGTMMLTHKVPLLLVIGVLVFVAAQSIINTIWMDGFDIKSLNLLRLIFVVGILQLFQWVFLTDFVGKTVYSLASAIFLDSSIKENPIPSNGAISLSNNLAYSLGQNSHLIVYATLGAVAGLVAFVWYRSNHQAWPLLGAASIPFGFVGLAYFQPTLSPPNRFVMFGEWALLALIALVIVELAVRSKSNLSKFGVMLLTASVVFALLLNPFVAPETQNTPRFYLTEQEVVAKKYANSKTDSIIYTDTYLAYEAVNISDPKSKWPITKNSKYRSIDSMLVNGNISAKHEYVLLRESVRKYRIAGGQWRLTYSPSDLFDINYNRVYTNGNATLYNS